MSKYKKLLGNSALFAIGNLGSKLINIILVPLYTYYLSTTDYGIVDIVQTTAKMLLPIISLSIYDAVLRFVMDNDEDNQAVFTNSTLLTISGSLLAVLLYPILAPFNLMNGLVGYMIVILILQAFQNLMAQFARGIGEIKVFAINGLFMALVTGISNYMLLVVIQMGITGYLLSIIIANIFSILFLSVFSKAYRYFDPKKINAKLLKKMMIYSLPLIPNAFMWWVINASNRYFVIFFVGASANGLFAVANKIPSLLSVLNTIFIQAWQLSAIEEYQKKESENFFSEVFYYFQMFMLLGAAGLIAVIRPAMRFFVAPDYFSAWEYVPFLLLGIVFSSYSGFLGANYVAAKKTSGVFKTSIFGGIINIIANLLLIPLIGTNGAGIATMLSFFVMWILRIRDTRHYVELKIDIKNLVSNLMVISLQIFALFFVTNSIYNISIQLGLILLLLIINRSLLIPMKTVLSNYKNKS